MDDSFFDQIRIFNSNYAEDSIFLVIQKEDGKINLFLKLFLTIRTVFIFLT